MNRTISANGQYALGNVVVNLTSQIARVVGFHENGDLILRALGRDGRVWGGKWIADYSKTRLLTPDEIQRWYAGGTEIIR